jgi:hypothetical protein
MASQKKPRKQTKKQKPDEVLRGATGTDTSDPIPPGATQKAFQRPENPERGPASSGAGNMHAQGEAGGGNLVTGLVDDDDADTPTGHHPEDEHDESAYSGLSGGAVGGTPAGGRATGGHVHGGIKPEGVHRGDSTLGTVTSKRRSPRGG